MADQTGKMGSPGISELEFADSKSKTAYRRRKEALARGELRAIAPKIFTRNLSDSPEQIIRRNWKEVLGYLYPGAVVSHRTAFDLKPTEEGFVHLTYTYTKKRKLPGLTVLLFQGPEKLEDDMPLPGGLILASEARKALENLEVQHSARTHKAVARETLEAWLESLLNARGEKGLNQLRDRAREIAGEHWRKEFKKLDAIIGALLRTRPAGGVLQGEIALRRAQGHPYDQGRIRLFDVLFTELSRQVVPSWELPPQTYEQRQAFAFFESYFSNFIEGTEFEVQEAKEIVFDGKIPVSRPKDGHDILGVFALASQKSEMSQVPSTAEDLVEILKGRHHKMLANRPEARPGQFKEKRNRAGETYFVDPELVLGTLRKGFEYYQGLPVGFARAAFMMFLIAEIHPFDDGNGRLGRLLMNAELSHVSSFRVLIPIVYREDYLTALRRLSRQGDPTVFIKMLERAYQFSSLLRFSGVADLEAQLTECGAFKEPQGNVLIMPGERKPLK